MITYLSLSRRLKKVGKNVMVLGANNVSLGYWSILAEFMINIGAIKNMAIN